MKKLIIFALLPLLLSCTKEDDFAYERGEISPDQITRMEFYVGTDRMIADGHAKLQFVVEAFREVQELDDDGNPITVEVPVKLSALPADAFGVFLEKAGGDVEVDPNTYSTDDATPGAVTFYAKLGDTESPRKTVTLRPAPAPLEKLYVDVVFHVFELDQTDPAYNELSYTALDYTLIETAIQSLNGVMNNYLGGNPNAASANIEFRMATHDPAGNVLEHPGYNKITYTNTTLTTTVMPTSTSAHNIYDSYYCYMDGKTRGANNAILQGSSKVWDPDKYLNIVVPRLTGSSIAASSNHYPFYQIVPPEGTAQQFPASHGVPFGSMLGLAAPGEQVTLPLTDEQKSKVLSAYNSCILAPLVVFWPGYNRPISLTNYVGKFYGVVTTRVGATATTAADDYCDDTQRFQDKGTEMSQANLKTVVSEPDLVPTGEKFYANNATDDVTGPSLRNNFTLDQVTRMRYVIANCPGRQNGQKQ